MGWHRDNRIRRNISPDFTLFSFSDTLAIVGIASNGREIIFKADIKRNETKRNETKRNETK